MKLINVKKIFSTIIVAAALCSFMPASYQPDLSGTWKLNEGKSDLGQFGGRGIATKIVAEQKADAITLTKTSSMQGQENTTTETLLFSGKESELTMGNNAKKKSILKWSADGNTMIVTYDLSVSFNGQSFDIKGVENWSLSADGKNLTINTTLTTPQGDIATKAVYDK